MTLPEPTAAKTFPALYLDFDGVLHHSAVHRSESLRTYIDAPNWPLARLFDHERYLVDILTSFPTVKIVLSTTWVLVDGFHKARACLSPQLRARVVGATFHSRYHGGVTDRRQAFARMPRGQQVCEDVARRRPAAWVALDDDDQGWPADCGDNLVLCDGRLGISALTVRAALADKLRRACDLADSALRVCADARQGATLGGLRSTP